MKTYYTAEVDLIETADTAPKPPSAEEGRKAQRTVDVVNNIRKLHSLKPDESKEDVNAAVSYIQQLNPNVQKIDLREDEIVIRMKDGDLIPITKGDQADLFVESIINAVYKDRAVNLPDALKKAGVYDEGLTRHRFSALAGLDETVEYDTEVQGFDNTGKIVKVTPRSSYVASTNEDKRTENVTTAALGALSAMDFSNPQVSVLNIDRINDIDLPGTQSWVAGNRYENAVMYFVPGVMPYQVFVPEDGANNVVGRLNELVAEARAQDRQVTIEELRAAISPNNYDIYNTQDMRDANPVEQPTIERPTDNTQTASGGNVR